MAVTRTDVESRQAGRKKADLAVIDCDIHNTLASPDILKKYLPQRWHQQVEMVGFKRSYSGSYYPRLHPNAARVDAWLPDGGIPGSDLDFMREQLLDAWNIEYGILNALYPAGQQTNTRYGTALASALNEWLVNEWLDREPRLRAAMLVNYEHGPAAAAEIERCAADPRFVQVLLPARTREPLGRPRYWPMYEAAVRHDLPIGMHFGGSGGWPITGAGWPSFYIEDHAGMSQSFQAQVISLVCEGVFETFPTLKFVLIEGGFAWLPPLMWRLDRSWEALRFEVPHLKQPPSSYIRKHFWITTQPVEEPPEPVQFHQFLDHLAMNDRLLFATDYPHWDFDAPDQAIPYTLPQRLRRAILADNARQLYRFQG